VYLCASKYCRIISNTYLLTPVLFNLGIRSHHSFARNCHSDPKVNTNNGGHVQAYKWISVGRADGYVHFHSRGDLVIGHVSCTRLHTHITVLSQYPLSDASSKFQKVLHGMNKLAAVYMYTLSGCYLILRVRLLCSFFQFTCHCVTFAEMRFIF